MAEAFLKARTVKQINEIPGKLFDVYDLRTASEFTDPLIKKINVQLGNNSNLKLVNLPNCSIVGYAAFQNCPNLSRVELNNCTTGGYAFAYCQKIDKLIIRGYSCSIGYYILNGGLSTDMYLLTETVADPPWGYMNLSLPLAGARSIYVTPSLYSDYLANSSWTTISSKIFPYEGGI